MSTTQLESKGKKDFFKQVIDQVSSIDDEINHALRSIKDINSRTHMLSTTAKIEANRTGEIGRNFLVVSNSIDELSQQTDEAILKMKQETIQHIENVSDVIERKSISIKGNRLANLALTNIRLVDRSLFERSADIRWWATDDILVNSLTNQTEEGFKEVEKRLAVILKSYTVYYDLILCDTKGKCHATGSKKFGLEGRHFYDKTWFQKAMATKDGNEYGFQTVHHSQRINDDYTVVFSCKIHEQGNPENKIIGVLAAVFKWREFAQRIVNETAISDEEKAKTRVLICEDYGNILVDTNEKLLEIINFKGRDTLFEKKKGFVVAENNGHVQLISHALSPGFEGYKSSQWHSLVIQELDSTAKISDLSDTDESLDSVTQLVTGLAEETHKATHEISKINDETHVLSLNAAIEASRVGDVGRGFGVISGFMGELSRRTAEITKEMSQKTQDKISLLYSFLEHNSKQIQGEKLANLSLTNLDLIDRALYERTADVRWWATDNSIVKALVLKTDESKRFLENRLRTILRFYTVYEDLIVYDLDGNTIMNNSHSNVIESNQANTRWYQNAIKTTNGEKFSFDVIKTKNSEDISLIFSCKIHRNGDVTHEAIGVLAIIFRWDKFIKTIFEETPLNKNEIEKNSMIITDNKGQLLARVDKHKDKITSDAILPLLCNEKNFQTLSLDSKELLFGHAASTGYEGFSTGWHSFIVQNL